MRKWILNIHTYGCLLCAPYLLILGISSLNFNHHFAPDPKDGPSVALESKLQGVVPDTNTEKYTENVRDAAGMLGWPLPWETQRSTNGDLRFAMEQPGKSYKIEFSASDGSLKVKEKHKGFLNTLNALHGMTGTPNSSFATVWGIYTNVCAGVGVFAAFSGIYLWLSSEREKKAGTALVAFGSVFSIAFILYIVLAG